MARRSRICGMASGLTPCYAALKSLPKTRSEDFWRASSIFTCSVANTIIMHLVSKKIIEQLHLGPDCSCSIDIRDNIISERVARCCHVPTNKQTNRRPKPTHY